MLKWLKTYNSLTSLSITEYAARFKDPLLRQGLPSGMPPAMPASMALATFAFHSRRNVGCPIGGSLAFTHAIARRFCELGGRIHYNSRVEKILVEPGGGGCRAVGVRLAGGEEVHSDWVISAADGYSTIYHLLEGRFVDEAIQKRYTDLERTPPCIQISLGVRRDLSGEPHSQVDLLGRSLFFAGQDHPSLWYQFLNYDPSFAPPGKTAIVARIRSNYAYWKALAGQPECYEAGKQEAAFALIDHLERLYPGLASEVEVIDVATPLTFERFTGNREGVYQSFAMTPATAIYAQNGMDPALPGLERFYQVGQWVLPNGGVFPAARSGRETLKKICAADRRRFTTSLPS
jgi:phytoene dehydrogenase-like protein